MQDFLEKKITDLTIIEALKYAYLVAVFSKITLKLEEFCEITGKDKRQVYKLLKNKAYPERILSGGYESMKQRKSPVFITEEVLKWIK